MIRQKRKRKCMEGKDIPLDASREKEGRKDKEEENEMHARKDVSRAEQRAKCKVEEMGGKEYSIRHIKGGGERKL
jgi:hypothetical protein